MERFDGKALWPTLTREQQEDIGAIALELVAAWACLDHGRPDLPNAISRAGEHADHALLSQLQGAFVEAVPRDAVYAGDVPRVPSMIGAVCRACGCSEYDPCEGGCGWHEPDLCTACVPRRAT